VVIKGSLWHGPELLAVRMPVGWFNDDGGCGVADAGQESIEAVSVCGTDNRYVPTYVAGVSRWLSLTKHCLRQRGCDGDETWSAGRTVPW